MTQMSPAGWYVDPITHQHLRWWNGQAWTESVAPLPGSEPAPAPAPAPQVQPRFALPASDEATHAASEQTLSRRQARLAERADAAAEVAARGWVSHPLVMMRARS